MKLNQIHLLLSKGALQTFRNINSTNRQTLEDVLVIFRRNTSNLNPKPQQNTSGTKNDEIAKLS